MPLSYTSRSLPERIIDAALIACLLTTLAFQSIRFEPYEAEKSALLLLLAGVICAALLLRSPKVQLSRHPLSWMIVGLLIVGGISTLFAFSPSMSLWGSPYRSQGWLSLLSGLLIFWGTLNASDDFRYKLGLTLCLTAIALCCIAWITFLGLDTTFPQTDRPSATTGNANFLANWLSSALLLILPLLTIPGRLRILAISTCAFILATILLTTSRSALLSLFVALIFAAVLWGALTRRRWIPILVSVVALVGIAIYLLAGQVFSSRLLSLDDPVRLSIWADGILLAREINQPLDDANGVPDQWASIRPLTGYGLDNLEQTFPRLSATLYYLGSWIDRFHNLFLDNFLSLGWPGLLLQIGIYGGALYSGFRALGLLPTRRSLLLWLLSIVGWGILGALATLPFAVDTNEYRAVVMIAFGLGALSGLIIWCALRAWTPLSSTPSSLTSRHWLVIALLAFIIQQWFANLFHFQTVIGQSVWWIALGLLAHSGDLVSSSELPAEPANLNLWWLIPLPGLFLLNTIGISMQNTFVTVQTGQWFTPIALTLLITAVGWFTLRPPRHYLLPTLILLVVDWVSVTILRAVASRLAESALQNLSPLPLVLAVGLLSLIGLVTVVLVLVILVRQLQPASSTASISPSRGLVASAVIMLAILLYAVPFTGNALQKISDQVGSQNLPPAQMSADLALLYSPVLNRVYFGRAYLVLSSNLTERFTRAREEITHLTERDPFMSNSLEIIELRDYLK